VVAARFLPLTNAESRLALRHRGDGKGPGRKLHDLPSSLLPPDSRVRSTVRSHLRRPVGRGPVPNSTGGPGGGAVGNTSQGAVPRLLQRLDACGAGRVRRTRQRPIRQAESAGPWTIDSIRFNLPGHGGILILVLDHYEPFAVRGHVVVGRSRSGQGRTNCSCRASSASPRALSAQVQTHANHETPGIDEHGRLSEVRAIQVVGCESLLGTLVERVQHIQEQLDSAYASERNAFR
jgi:hypothetical protein